MDERWQGSGVIEARDDLADGYFKLVLRLPEVARRARPGLFVNLLVPAAGLCLRRPLSLHEVVGDSVSLVVGQVGEGTRWLASQPVGTPLDVVGPLGGRGLSILPGAQRVALVGGGVGIPPLHFLARSAPEVERVAFLGARSADRLLCLEEFAAAGCEVRPSTDDGSRGFAGTAVAALEAALAEQPVDQILCCGPTPMMRAVADVAAAWEIPCQVCLEARMACGLGACLSCVVETTRTDWQRYLRVCTEGPVFDAAELVWESLSPLCAA